MNASVRTRHASLSLWEASVEQTLSLRNVSALKRRQTLWEYADVTPAAAHSQTRCLLIDSWMIREPTTLMHAKGHLTPMTAAACAWGRTEHRHPSICVTLLLILCSWTLHHPALPKTSQAETPGLEISYELFRKKEAWPCLLRSASSQCKLECESPSLHSWSLKNCWYSENIQFALCSGRTLKYFFFLRM